MAEYHIGCSGFHNKDWKDGFYKDITQKNWFKHYASRFNSLEVNSSFYRYPKLEALQNWYNNCPDDFSFSIKAPRTITHYRQFKNISQPSLDFHNLIKDGLKEKLSCLLYQLPATLKFSLPLLDRILSSLDYSVKNVIEFRDVSWWTQDVYDALTARGVIFCSISHPDLPQDLIQTTPDLYVRFHGVPKLYYSSYPDTELNSWAAKLKNTSLKQAYIYFNNTITESALSNAVFLRVRL